MPRNIIFLLQPTHLRCSDSIARHRARCSPAHTRTHHAAKSESALTRQDSRRKRRATNPRTGGRPTPDLAGNDPRTAGHRYFLTWRLSWRPAGTTPGYCPRSVPCGAPHRGRGHFTSEPYVASEVACGHSPLVFPSVPSVLSTRLQQR